MQTAVQSIGKWSKLHSDNMSDSYNFFPQMGKCEQLILMYLI